MIKLFNESIGRLSLTKTKSLIQASMIVGTLVALLSPAGEALGHPVAPSNPFVILLDGIYEPAVDVANLGLSQVDLNDGSFSKVAIYNIDSGFPSPTDKAVGTFYAQFAGDLCAYELPKGALTARFVGSDVEVTDNGDGSSTLRGTWELNILEATGIYRSFAGGHIHMVDVLKFNSDGTVLEHCFCYISRKHGKP